MAENPTCHYCGRKVPQVGALTCSWCGKTLRKHPHTGAGFQQTMREALTILRRLSPKDQEDALEWLRQSLRLQHVVPDPKQGELFGFSASSTQAPSSETAGPESPDSGSTFVEQGASPAGPGSPPPTMPSSPTASPTPRSSSSKTGERSSKKAETPPSQ